jgi:hypothetical protein
MKCGVCAGCGGAAEICGDAAVFLCHTSKLDGQVQASLYNRSFASFLDDVSSGAAARYRYRQLRQSPSEAAMTVSFCGGFESCGFILLVILT